MFQCKHGVSMELECEDCTRVREIRMLEGKRLDSEIIELDAELAICQCRITKKLLNLYRAVLLHDMLVLMD